MPTQRKKSPRRSAKLQAGEDSKSLEGQIVRLALTGKLARAGRRAIRRQRDHGLPVTFKRGQQVIKQFPDGREEVIETITTPRYVLPVNVPLISSK